GDRLARRRDQPQPGEPAAEHRKAQRRRERDRRPLQEAAHSCCPASAVGDFSKIATKNPSVPVLAGVSRATWPTPGGLAPPMVSFHTFSAGSAMNSALRARNASTCRSFSSVSSEQVT